MRKAKGRGRKMDKTSYEKGIRDGFLKGIEAAEKVLHDCEKDPQDMTRLSLKVSQELASLKCD